MITFNHNIITKKNKCLNNNLLSRQNIHMHMPMEKTPKRSDLHNSYYNFYTFFKRKLN